MRNRITSFAIIMLMLCTPVSAFGDEIIMDNGDRLTGTVKNLEGDTLILETGYSEPVRIMKSRIRNIVTSGPAEVHMTDGEVLKGKISLRESGLVVEKSEGRGETAVSWQNVAAINPPPAAQPKWKGSIAVGANSQSGNTKRTSTSIEASAKRKTGRDRFGVRVLFNYAEDDNEVTARNTYGEGKYDYFFTEKLYGYVGLELLNDTFKNLNLRTVVGPGVGYQVWDDDVRTLQLEGGVSYFSEDLKTGADDQWATGRLAGDIGYIVSKYLALSNYLIIYPSFDQAGEYQLRNEASLKSALGGSWSLKLSNIFERDSDTEEGVKKNDWQWILGLQYDFNR